MDLRDAIVACVKETDFFEAKAKEYLVGACLDKIVVYSVEIQLCLISAIDNSYVWVSACGDGLSDRPSGSLDFFVKRGEFIKDIYGLMGGVVSNVQLLNDGTLKIYFGERFFVFCSNDDISEIIWSITSDTPAPFDSHRFSIDLVEGDKIIVEEGGTKYVLSLKLN
jgi:hypothetical protein